MARTIFDSLSPADKRNAYANIIVKLKETNDPRFPEARNWYLQTYDPPVESDYYEGYQGPSQQFLMQHEKPSYTEYQQSLVPKWDETPGFGQAGRQLPESGAIEWLTGMKEKFFPPTLEEVQQRPYRVKRTWWFCKSTWSCHTRLVKFCGASCY